MQLFIDFLLIGVFAFLVVRGWWRGFIKTVLGFGRLLLAFILTLLLGPVFSGWLDQTFFNPAVYESVHAKLSELAAEVSNSAETGVQALIDRLPATYRDHLDLAAIDLSAHPELLADGWAHTISDGISRIISVVVGCILLFALCFVLLTVAIFLIGKCTEMFSLVRNMDKFLGLVLGLVSGVIAVMLLSVVLGALLALFGQGELVDNSLLLRLFAGVREMILR